MKTEKAIFAGGCFWCTEAVFQNLKGVQEVVPGYIGGHGEAPSYEQISKGSTGYAEAIEITFDPAVITYKELLYVFFYTHNPTTLNQQGADTGTQYRSAIYYLSGAQKNAIEFVMTELETEETFKDEIVTEASPVSDFYPAEEYHRNYFKTNPDKPYCQVVIIPKLEKLKSKFAHLLKDEGVL